MSRVCPLCYAESDDNALNCAKCGVEFENADTGNDCDVLRKYIITCPICGKEYEVDSASSTIDKCDNEDDEFDKIQIRSQRARVVEIVKQSKEEKRAAKRLSLIDVRTDKIIIIDDAGGIIGRSGDFESEYFKNNPYVSSMHFKVFCQDGEWYVEHLSNTNPTTVNGTKLLHDIRFKVNDGDRIIIPECCLKVSIKEELI